MKGRTLFADCLARHAHYLCAPLILLTVASLCWGQQRQPGGRLRSARQLSQKTIQLPEAATSGTFALERALIEQQRAILPSDQRLRYSHIGQLAWAAQGVRVPQTTAAAGAATAKELLLLKVYFLLPEGTYLYNPLNHALEQTGGQDERQAMSTALMGQPGGPVGGVQIVLAGSSREFASRYGVRAKSIMLLQAGQAGQSIQLQAAAMGLTSVSVENANMNSVRRVVRLAQAVEPLHVLFIGYPGGQTPTVVTEPPATTQPLTRKVLFVVPAQGFQDQELFDTKRGLELAGVSTAIASTRLGSALGILSGTAPIDMLINQAKIEDYGAVVFIGGPGAIDHFTNPTAQNLARQAAAQQKIVAAIGTAPTILANAGVLKGARATGFLPEQSRIQQGGAIYTGNPVEKDNLLITATGALATPLFVQALLEGLGEGG